MRYEQVIIEGYKEAEREFSQSTELPQVKDIIQKYRSLVNRNQVQGNERNIDWWRRQGWETFSRFVDQKINQPSFTQLKRKKIAGQSIILRETDDWLVVIPLNKNSSCFHGKNSDWCTAKPDHKHFEDYFYKEGIILIYCLNKKTGGMWAIAAGQKKMDIFTQQDKKIPMSTFTQQTGLDALKLVVEAMKHKQTVKDAQDKYKDAEETVRKGVMDIFSKNSMGKKVDRDLHIEELLELTNDAGSSYVYISCIGPRDDYPERIQAMALTHSSQAINFLKNPPERVQALAVKRDWRALENIANPSERIQLIAVNNNGLAIVFIENPSERVQLAAVNEQPSVVRYIKDPSDAVQIAAITNDWEVIWDIMEGGTVPCEKAQIIAVSKKAKAYHWIVGHGIKPSESVKKAAGLI